MPFGLFLSPLLDRPIGSNVDGILSWSRPCLINLLTSLCLIFQSLACLHYKPRLPFDSTILSQLHSWGWQWVAPRRRPQAMCSEHVWKFKCLQICSVQSSLFNQSTTFKVPMYSNMYVVEQFFCVGLGSICYFSCLDSCLQTYVLRNIKTARFIICLS